MSKLLSILMYPLMAEAGDAPTGGGSGGGATTAPALGDEAQADAGQTAAITEGAAAEALHLNTGDVNAESAGQPPIGSLDAVAAAMTGDAGAPAASAAPNPAEATLVAGADSAVPQPAIQAEDPPESVKQALSRMFGGAEQHLVADVEHVHAWFASLLAKAKAEVRAARDWLTVEEAKLHFATNRGVASVQVQVDGKTKTLNRDGSFA